MTQRNEPHPSASLTMRIQAPEGYESSEEIDLIDVTHSERNIDAERRAQIRAAFERHLTPEGARFQKPHRVDLLRKPV